MSSTAPRLEARCPGLTAQHSTMYDRTSAQSSLSSAASSFLRSAGESILSSILYIASSLGTQRYDFISIILKFAGT